MRSIVIEEKSKLRNFSIYFIIRFTLLYSYLAGYLVGEDKDNMCLYEY